MFFSIRGGLFSGLPESSVVHFSRVRSDPHSQESVRGGSSVLVLSRSSHDVATHQHDGSRRAPSPAICTKSTIENLKLLNARLPTYEVGGIDRG